MTPACRRAVEGTGLALMVLLPIVFSPYAAAPFEPAKVSLFLATVAGLVALRAGCAAIARRAGSAAAARSAPQAVHALRHPLALPALLYAAAWMLATAASIDPASSLWGTGTRPQGCVLALALVAYFLLMAEAIRTPQQLDHALTAILLGSIPVAVYGLAQYLGLDPLAWAYDGFSPVISTLGSTVFVGAYLAMVAPFALLRMVQARDRATALRFAFVLGLQLACLFLTRARSAWLGLVAACLLFLGYVAWKQRARLVLLVFAAVLLVGVGLLAWMDLSLPARHGPPTAAETPAAVLSRFRTASMGERLIIWRGTLAIVPARWLLGYGPDTFEEVYRHRIPQPLLRGLPRWLAFDDAHNILLQHLASTGVAGLLAFLGLLASLARVSWGALRQGRDRASELTLLASVCSATAYLVYAQFNPVVVSLSALFWLELALVVAAAAREPLGQGSK